MDKLCIYNYLPEGRKLTSDELNRHYMKNLTSEFDSEKIDLKNEENLKTKFAAVFGTLNVEGADADKKCWTRSALQVVL